MLLNASSVLYFLFSMSLYDFNYYDTFIISVGDELISSIGQGICVLVGISGEDNAKDLEYM